MARTGGSGGWLARILCWVLVGCMLANLAAAAAAWHRYGLLRVLTPEHPPYGGVSLLNADMWLGNLMGWRRAMIAASGLLLIGWLDSMRSLADVVWPEGQRRSRMWLLLGWAIPIGNLFVIKMFVNDLWAAGRADHRRGNPLLMVWWLSVLVAFGSSWARLGGVPEAGHAEQAWGQMRELILSDALVAVAASLTIAVVRRLGGVLERAVPEPVGDVTREGGGEPVAA